jgi:ATP-binding cassette subfamily F protein 3
LTNTADSIASPYPPPFSSLYFPPSESQEAPGKAVETHTEVLEDPAEQPPAFSSLPPGGPGSSSSAAAAESVVAGTKAALPGDSKDGCSKDFDDGEPPPPYTEGSSPLAGFTYVMATAGGPASIITQVSQGGGGGGGALNALGSGKSDSTRVGMCTTDLSIQVDLTRIFPLISGTPSLANLAFSITNVL